MCTIVRQHEATFLIFSILFFSVLSLILFVTAILCSTGARAAAAATAVAAVVAKQGDDGLGQNLSWKPWMWRLGCLGCLGDLYR